MFNYFPFLFQDAYIESLYFFSVCVKYPECRVPIVQSVGLPNKNNDGIRVSTFKKFIFKMLRVEKEDNSKWIFQQSRLKRRNGDILVDIFACMEFVGMDGAVYDVPLHTLLGCQLHINDNCACAGCCKLRVHKFDDDDELLMLPPTRRPYITVYHSDDRHMDKFNCQCFCKCNVKTFCTSPI